MNVLYFAWVRERIGAGHEQIDDIPETVADLIALLSQRSDGHAAALGQVDQLRVAVDQALVPLDHPLKNAREVAIFPPMTGG
ncbi:MAG: molybdopterin converting factor subunit 1 [Pseudomonadota bacterium]